MSQQGTRALAYQTERVQQRACIDVVQAVAALAAGVTVGAQLLRCPNGAVVPLRHHTDKVLSGVYQFLAAMCQFSSENHMHATYGHLKSVLNASKRHTFYNESVIRREHLEELRRPLAV